MSNILYFFVIEPTYREKSFITIVEPVFHVPGIQLEFHCQCFIH